MTRRKCEKGQKNCLENSFLKNSFLQGKTSRVEPRDYLAISSSGKAARFEN
jgi:hypothetical protein